ncbi:alpha/beta hydrolase [Streptomyces thermolineatus]|uniref:alpha/beta hydrolase n=1 Tax=Streptomyces thermolineatus TaxID=44033 RepID=UPI00384CD3A3
MRQLQDLNLSSVDKAADEWGRMMARLGAGQDRVDREMSAKLRNAWGGTAAKTAMDRLDRLSQNFQYGYQESGYVRTLLNGCADELRVQQKNLKAALEEAESHKFTVDDTGKVTYPPIPEEEIPMQLGTPDDGPAWQHPTQVRAQDIADRIAKAVTKATEIDQRYGTSLKQLTADDGLKISAATWADVAKDRKAIGKDTEAALDLAGIPSGSTPAQNAAWWKGLSKEDQQQYLALHPERIGALDGLPSAVRDDANRVVLRTSRGELEMKIAELKKNEPKQEFYDDWWVVGSNTEHDKWQKELDELEGKRDGAAAVQKRLDHAGTDGLPDAYLLGFDTDKLGHAVVANGNPDTADHTAVFVPGTGSNLAGADGDMKRMADLWRESSEKAPGQQVSTITWIGYDAPQSIVPEAMDRSYAVDGAPRLNGFLDGLQTAQGGPDASHTTVIGHSYGSTTVGAASMHGDLPADDIIAVGSPGMLVGEADQLDVGGEHVWSQKAPLLNDQVALGGKIAGHGGLGPDHDLWDVPIGNVPSDEAFGANRMATDSPDHSSYWEPESVSLENQAWVVTGRYDEVTDG